MNSKLMQWFLLVSILTLVLGVLSCAPPAAPGPTPLPTAVPATPKAAPAAPLSAEERTWNEVVQAAKKEGTLTIYSYNYVGQAGIDLARAFQDRYGIKLEIITGRGAEFVERVKTEQRMKQVSTDAMEGATTHLGIAKAAGLLEAVGKELPAFREKGVWHIEPQFVDPEGYILPIIPQIAPPFINTNLVKPGDEPKSWQELLEPKWKGKIMLQDPAIGTGAYRLIGYISHNIFNEDFLRRLGEQNPLYTTGIQQEAQMLARGERALSLYIGTSEAGALVAEGAPIKTVSMKEGVVSFYIVAGAVKNAPHPNAVKVFLNWLLTQDGQRVSGEAKKGPSIRKDVPDFIPAAARVDTKLLVLTPQMLDEQTKLFGEKYLVKLWRK